MAKNASITGVLMSGRFERFQALGSLQDMLLGPYQNADIVQQ